MRKTRIIAGLLILLLIAGCNAQEEQGRKEDEVYQVDPVSGEDVVNEQNDFNDASSSEESTDMTSNGEKSFDELVAAVQESKFITLELVEIPDTQTTLPAEEMEELKSYLMTDNLEPVDYNYIFIPEYQLSCDTGAQFYIMQDSTSSDYNLYVLQFAGSDIYYSADQTIYHTCARMLTPSIKDNMSLMHVFENGVDAEAAIDAVLKVNGVDYAAYEYFQENGYSLASVIEDDIFRVDGYTVEDMSVIDPSLSSILIAYSVKTAYEDSEDTWVTGNVFVGAVWLDQRDSQVRAYLLGVEPYLEGSERSCQDITQSIYQNSIAFKLTKGED